MLFVFKNLVERQSYFALRNVTASRVDRKFEKNDEPNYKVVRVCFLYFRIIYSV